MSEDTPDFSSDVPEKIPTPDEPVPALWKGVPVEVIGLYERKGKKYARLSTGQSVLDAKLEYERSSGPTETEAGVEIDEHKQPDLAEDGQSPEPQESGQDKDDGGGNDGGTKDDELEGEENTWLDPRRIEELQPKYKALLKELRKENPSPPDENNAKNHKTVLKTAALESLITEELEAIRKNYEIASKENPDAKGLKITEAPTEEIKSRMLTLLDWPEEEIHKAADVKEQQIDMDQFEKATGKYSFKAGQEVQHVSMGKRGTWIVKGVKHLPSGDTRVELINKENPKDQHFAPRDSLRKEQEWEKPEDLKSLYHELKEYFNKPCKIKLPNGEIVEGRDLGISVRGTVYVHYDYYETDAEGNDVKKTYRWEAAPHDFLDWQNEKTSAEKQDEEEAEKAEKAADEEAKAQKIERIEKDVPKEQRKFELGKEVKIIRNKTGNKEDAELESGWMVDDFKMEDGKVIVRLIKDGEEFTAEVPQELLENWQLAPDSYPVIPERPRILEKEEPKELLSWWERAQNERRKMSRPRQAAATFLGFTIFQTGVGIIGSVPIAVQHRITKHRRERKQKREQEKMVQAV